MTFSMIVLTAFIAVASLMTFTLRLIRFRSIVRLHWLFDATVHVLLFSMFAGTLTGMLIAATGGLMFSLLMSAARGAIRARVAVEGHLKGAAATVRR